MVYTRAWVVHWVPEQLNIKAVTKVCKLIDGCSLALCFGHSFSGISCQNQPSQICGGKRK